jgi:N-acyl-phosphatidylethanolamine-hydrolysing phospholipase D
MDPEEAVKSHILLGSKFSVGMHWGTFILSQEGVTQPKTDLETNLVKYKVDPSSFRTLDIGESVELPCVVGVRVKT